MTQPAVRPDSTWTPDTLAVYDWLRANGVDEWLPQHPTITTDGQTLTYSTLQWDGERGWDASNIRPFQPHEPATRTVPLQEPMPANVRAILDARQEADDA
jgi:hypothetical protein